MLIQEAFYFFGFYSSIVEIVRDNQIEEIYFIKLPYTTDLTNSEKDSFNRKVDRGSTHQKVTELMGDFQYLATSMQFKYKIRTTFFGIISLFFTHENFYKTLSFIMVCPFIIS